MDLKTAHIVKKAHQHAAGCKKAPGDCAACQLNIQFFESLPLSVLSEALEERTNVKR